MSTSHFGEFFFLEMPLSFIIIYGINYNKKDYNMLNTIEIDKVINSAMVAIEGTSAYNLYLQLSKSNKKNVIVALPIIIELLYCFSDTDGEIDSREIDVIKQVADSIITDYSTFPYRDEEVLNTAIASIEKLNSSSNNVIELSEILYKLTSIEDWSKVLSSLQIDNVIERILVADSKITAREEILRNRYKLFLKSDNKIESIKNIQHQEAEDSLGIPRHFKYVNKLNNQNNNKDTKFKNGLEIIDSQNKEFLNISDLAENEYYILHPVNSNYLYPLSQITMIKENTIDEIFSIAAALGALEITINVDEKIEETVDTSFSGKISSIFSSGGRDIGAGVERTRKINNETKTTFTHNKTKKFKTGHKLDKQLVSNKQLWTKSNASIRELIDNIYSPNPIAEWNEIIYFKKFFSAINNDFYKSYSKIAGKLDSDITVDMKKEITMLSEKSMNISMKF